MTKILFVLATACMADDGLNLLQTKIAAHSNLARQLETTMTTTCAADVAVSKCSLWGDVHQSHHFPGGRNQDQNAAGWGWAARSADQTSFQWQFYNVPERNGNGAITFMTNSAFKFGNTSVVGVRRLDPELDKFCNENRIGGHGYCPFAKWRLEWQINNGQIVKIEDMPITVDGVTFALTEDAVAKKYEVNPELIWGQHKTQNRLGWFGEVKNRRFVTITRDCIKIITSFAIGSTYKGAVHSDMGPGNNWMAVWAYFPAAMMDNSFASCGSESKPTTPAEGEFIATPEHTAEICKQNRDQIVKYGKDPDVWCAHPDPLPAPPTADEICAEKGINKTWAEEACSCIKMGNLEEGEGDELFQDCVYDTCDGLSPDDEVEVEEEEEEQEGQKMHPCAKTTTTTNAPTLDEICDKNPVLQLKKPVFSNLGGKGPDAGEKGLVYPNAGVINGVSVDIKMTSIGPYNPFKAAQNGVTGALGQVNMALNSQSTFLFSLLESGTSNPVNVEGMSLTFLDIDEGKKGKGRGTVSACGVQVALTSNTELTSSVDGDCVSVSSAKKGSGKDNPSSTTGLTDVQLAKIATFNYGAGSSFKVTLAMAPKGKTGRNFNFAFEPVIPCVVSGGAIGQ